MGMLWEVANHGWAGGYDVGAMEGTKGRIGPAADARLELWQLRLKPERSSRGSSHDKQGSVGGPGGVKRLAGGAGMARRAQCGEGQL